MDVLTKLEILADAAKYDASCASSGSRTRNSLKGRGIGSTEGMGICHSYAPDGRCISLLKILLTNFCVHECSYCINRNSSNVRRARFTVEEVVQLTLDFYRRNYIEGLFLSSGVVQDPDYTMAQIVEVARRLREDHDFRGYIHLKTIPDADGELLAAAGRHADRLSINVELPSREALADLAPGKDHRTIRLSMARIRERLDATKADRVQAARIDNRAPAKRLQRFAPAGQSTQMIVGEDPSTDARILSTSATLYSSYRLKRVYYSAFSPIPDASARLPATRAPLVREHRLYQSDWLMRFYGYRHDEITASEADPTERRATGIDTSAGTAPGMLSLDIDPKLGWALRNRQYFPVDLNRGTREQLLRVPGLGLKTVERLLRMRRHANIRLADLTALRAGVGKALAFIICADHRPSGNEPESARLRAALAAPPAQLALAFPDDDALALR